MTRSQRRLTLSPCGYSKGGAVAPGPAASPSCYTDRPSGRVQTYIWWLTNRSLWFTGAVWCAFSGDDIWWLPRPELTGLLTRSGLAQGASDICRRPGTVRVGGKPIRMDLSSATQQAVVTSADRAAGRWWSLNRRLVRRRREGVALT